MIISVLLREDVIAPLKCCLKDAVFFIQAHEKRNLFSAFVMVWRETR